MWGRHQARGWRYGPFGSQSPFNELLYFVYYDLVIISPCERVAANTCLSRHTLNHAIFFYRAQRLMKDS